MKRVEKILSGGRGVAVRYVNADDGGARSVSYSELATVCGYSRGYLAGALRLKRGAAVAVLMGNCLEVVYAYLTAWSGGWVAVPLNLKTDDIETMVYKLRVAKAKVLVVRSDQVDGKLVKDLRKTMAGLRIWEVAAGDWEKTVMEYGRRRKATEGGKLILYTSGSTGSPKGAVLTVSNLLHNADQIVEWLHITRRERFLLVLPMHHINSTVFLLAVFLAGGRAVLASRYSATSFWRLVQENGVTGSSIVPTIAYDLLRTEKVETRMKRMQIGSAPVRADVCVEFYKKFGIRLIQGYGQTETALRSTGVPMVRSKKRYLEYLKANTIGTSLKWTRVAVLDRNGWEVRAGEEGEICVKGPTIMEKYVGLARETRASMKYGWFHSGDWGYYQINEGKKFFFLKSRIKELIIKGGVNISPVAVEEKLILGFDQISQVYAFGYPDERYGETVAVAMSFKHPGNGFLQEVRELARKGKLPLSAYETPSHFFEVRDDAWPRTAVGKIQRTKLLEMVTGQ